MPEPTIENDVTVFPVTDNLRTILKLMHFLPIPDEAKYLAFFPDGNAQFFEKLDVPPFTFLSNVTMINYATGISLEF